MSVSNNYVPIKQIGNGVTVNYSSNTWTVLAASYLAVYLEDTTTGVQVLQNNPADYALVFGDSGFVATFVTPPPNTKYVVMGRSTSLDQSVPYKTSSGYQGGVLEGSLDKLTDIAQENAQVLSRSLNFPLGDTTSGALPTVAARKGLFLYFDATTGAPMVGSGVAGGVVSAAMIPVVGASTLANARTAMGLGSAAVLNAAITRVVAQVFISSGTYTPTTGMVYAIIELVGGGGGGGGATGVANPHSSAGGGGGGGGYARIISSAATIGASQSVTIGAAGAAGAAAAGNGGAGGTSSFGAILTCGGGTGGGGDAGNTITIRGGGAGTGGSASGGAVNVVGGSGGHGIDYGSINIAVSGFGGSTAPFSNSAGAVVENTVGTTATYFGGGGSGGAANTVSKAGGAGLQGVCFITEFISA